MAIKVIAIIQARTGSTRLPQKVLMDVEGKTMLERVVNRVMKAKTLDSVVVATTWNESDDAIVKLCWGLGWKYYRGSEDDVLDRFYSAAMIYEADVVVRITADCPLIDAELIDEVVGKFLSPYPNIDYVSNVLSPRTYPRGLDTEVISMQALESEWRTSVKWREHVTLNLRNNSEKFRVANVCGEKDYSQMRWCVDTAEDLEFVRRIYKYFKGTNFDWRDVVQLLEKHPEWMLVDTQIDPK